MMTRRAFLGGLTLGALSTPRAAEALTLGGQAPGVAFAADGLHLVLTPSQKPTDLLATGEEFARVLTKLTDIPVRVTVASDYAAVIEALRNRTADLAFVHPVGYVLASREAKARIVARNLWHGKSTFTSRIYVRKDGGIKTLEDLRGKTMAFVDPSSSSGYTYPMVLLQMRGPAYASLLKRMYDIDGFEPAEDRDYDPVRAAVELLGVRPR